MIRKLSLFKTRSKTLCLAILSGNQNLIYNFENGKYLRSIKPNSSQPNPHPNRLILGNDFSITTDFQHKKRIVINQGETGLCLHDAFTGHLLKKLQD